MALPTTNCSLKAIADEYSANQSFAAPHSFSEYASSGSFQTFITNPAHYGSRQFVTIGTTEYSVLTFTTNSIWKVPMHVESIRYLIIGGGGGGGANGGGGGGAGGMFDGTLSVSPGTIYSFTVGQGGSQATGGTSIGTNGGNTVAFGITAYGGGFGASRDYNSAGGAGASGGGGAGWNFVNPNAGTPGSATVYSGTTQGYGGGAGVEGANVAGGGGGGAGGVGEAAQIFWNLKRGGNGGIGLQSDITGTNQYYAGGGPGGRVPAYASTTGTGGAGYNNYGGGGVAEGSSTTAGQSGVVIVRYALP